MWQHIEADATVAVAVPQQILKIGPHHIFCSQCHEPARSQVLPAGLRPSVSFPPKSQDHRRSLRLHPSIGSSIRIFPELNYSTFGFQARLLLFERATNSPLTPNTTEEEQNNYPEFTRLTVNANESEADVSGGRAVKASSSAMDALSTESRTFS